MEHQETLVYKVSEAAAALQKGKNYIYEEIAAGRLPALRLGRSIRIPKGAIEALLKGEAAKRAG